MSEDQLEVRGFKTTLTSIGVVYMILASSMLMRGAGVMRDFAVPESVVSAPVFQDFFLFFYQCMALIGVLTLVLGHVTRGRRAQILVASMFCVTNILITLRDLSTSDTRFGNHLYRGEATLVFVYIDLALAFSFGLLAITGLRARHPSAASF